MRETFIRGRKGGRERIGEKNKVKIKEEKNINGEDREGH